MLMPKIASLRRNSDKIFQIKKPLFQRFQIYKQDFFIRANEIVYMLGD